MECQKKSQDFISIYECACGWHSNEDENSMSLPCCVLHHCCFFYDLTAGPKWIGVAPSNFTKYLHYRIVIYAAGRYHAQWIEPDKYILLYSCLFHRCLIYLFICLTNWPIGIGYKFHLVVLLLVLLFLFVRSCYSFFVCVCAKYVYICSWKPE